MNNILLCPVCNCELTDKETAFTCNNGHSYDKAKEGYVNLLLANQKNSKEPGDNKLMMNARKSFLDSNAYKPLLDFITTTIQKLMTKNLTVLEAGCGEGYYISNLKKELPSIHAYGFDISKDAIKMATKRNKDINFYVSSSYKSNIKEKSVDCLLVVFAPFAEEEFYKILNDDGIIIVVKPNKNHLLEIKQQFYNNIKNKEQQSYKKFQLVKSRNIAYNIYPSKQQTLNLFKMTPFYYSVGEEKRRKFDDFEQKNGIKVDFFVEILQKIKNGY